MIRLSPSKWSLFAAILTLGAITPTVHAADPVVNGGFETGTFNPDWTINPSSLVTAATTGGLLGNSYEGTRFAALTTPAVGAVITGLDKNSTDTALGLTAGSINSNFSNYNHGVVITQDITVSGGSQLLFAYKFSTLETTIPIVRPSLRNDAAFVSITGPGTNAIFALASVNQVGALGTTAWLTDKPYTFTADGTYKIGFGVFNSNDNILPSTLRIDAVSVVPEPGVVAFGVLAAGSVLGLIARRRRN